ncbi:hypothetical protein E2P81_ATG09431 [Venturia nashicola]|nr:hypothetical protein E2P81_ATG09431 [Venturia nashicola]
MHIPTATIPSEAIKAKPAGTTYGVIHRLGLKYAPPAVARPTFATEATLAKEFWDQMFIVFDNFRRMAIDESSARGQILALVEEFGPRIWGVDRVNVVSYPCQHCPEYSKDLFWDEGDDIQQFIRDQAIALFETRLKKRDFNARKPGNSVENTPKHKLQSYTPSQYDHVGFPTTDASEIDDTSHSSELTESSGFSDEERVPYTLNVPQKGYNSEATSQRRKKRIEMRFLSYDCLNEHVDCRHPRTTALEEIPTPSTIVSNVPVAFAMPSSSSTQDNDHVSMGLNPTLSPATHSEHVQSALSTTSSERENSVDSRHTAISPAPCTMCRDKKVRCNKGKPVCWACSRLGRLIFVFLSYMQRNEGIGERTQQITNHMISNAQKCGKELPSCSTCSRLGKACTYTRRSSETSSTPSLNQEQPGQLPQQIADWDRRLLTEDVQASSLGSSEQYRKEWPVSSFTAVNHAKQPAALLFDIQSVLPPENPQQTPSSLPLSNDPEYILKPAVEQQPEKAISTPSMLPPPKTTPHQAHEQGSVNPTTTDGPNMSQPEKHLVIVNEAEIEAQTPPTSFPERKAAWQITLKDDWIISRLANTIIHIRAGDSWDNIITMNLGPTQHIDDFFARVSHRLRSTVTHLSILLPGNVAKLENYVIQITQGDQAAYENMLGILLGGIRRLGVGRPVRYVLAGTATCH